MALFGSADPEKHEKKRLVPGPVSPISLLGGTTPPDTTAARSAATAEAIAAAQRARKKAAGGTLLTGAPVARNLAPAVLAPKTLIGG